tara:strand:+ start:661 stop:2349 length:1689 start_codon:yes stop_codon:yes gene_type:complete
MPELDTEGDETQSTNYGRLALAELQKILHLPEGHPKAILPGEDGTDYLDRGSSRERFGNYIDALVGATDGLRTTLNDYRTAERTEYDSIRTDLQAAKSKLDSIGDRLDASKVGIQGAATRQRTRQRVEADPDSDTDLAAKAGEKDELVQGIRDESSNINSVLSKVRARIRSLDSAVEEADTTYQFFEGLREVGTALFDADEGQVPAAIQALESFIGQYGKLEGYKADTTETYQAIFEGSDDTPGISRLAELIGTQTTSLNALTEEVNAQRRHYDRDLKFAKDRFVRAQGKLREAEAEEQRLNAVVTDLRAQMAQSKSNLAITIPHGLVTDLYTFYNVDLGTGEVKEIGWKELVEYFTEGPFYVDGDDTNIYFGIGVPGHRAVKFVSPATARRSNQRMEDGQGIIIDGDAENDDSYFTLVRDRNDESIVDNTYLFRAPGQVELGTLDQATVYVVDTPDGPKEVTLPRLLGNVAPLFEHFNEQLAEGGNIPLALFALLFYVTEGSSGNSILHVSYGEDGDRALIMPGDNEITPDTTKVIDDYLSRDVQTPNGLRTTNFKYGNDL